MFVVVVIVRVISCQFPENESGFERALQIVEAQTFSSSLTVANTKKNPNIDLGDVLLGLHKRSTEDALHQDSSYMYRIRYIYVLCIKVLPWFGWMTLSLETGETSISDMPLGPKPRS